MQVDDPGQFMRATLQAAHYLVALRGMAQLVRAGDTDLRGWLARRERIERLEEPLFVEAARHFVALCVRHERRTEFVPPAKRRAAGRRKTRRRKRSGRGRRPAVVDDESDDEDGAGGGGGGDEDSEERDERRARAWAVRKSGSESDTRQQLVAVDGRQCLIERLCDSMREFVPRVEPFLFGSNAPLEQRVHAAADYHLVALMHTGFSSAETTRALNRGIEFLNAQREAKKAAFGATDARHVRTHLFVVLWGDIFHPVRGSRYRHVQREMRVLNDRYAESHAITFEAWSAVELQFDVTKHERVPTHTALADPTADSRVASIPVEDHRRLLDTDPQARAHGFRAGQLLCFERADIKLAGRTTGYAAVVRDERE